MLRSASKSRGPGHACRLLSSLLSHWAFPRIVSVSNGRLLSAGPSFQTDGVGATFTASESEHAMPLGAAAEGASRASSTGTFTAAPGGGSASFASSGRASGDESTDEQDPAEVQRLRLLDAALAHVVGSSDHALPSPMFLCIPASLR